MATIYKSDSGLGKNGYRIEGKIEVSYTASGSSGYNVAATLYTRVGPSYTSTSASNQSTASITIDGTNGGNTQLAINYGTIGTNWTRLTSFTKYLSLG